MSFDVYPGLRPVHGNRAFIYCTGQLVGFIDDLGLEERSPGSLPSEQKTDLSQDRYPDPVTSIDNVLVGRAAKLAAIASDWIEMGVMSIGGLPRVASVSH